MRTPQIDWQLALVALIFVVGAVVVLVPGLVPGTQGESSSGNDGGPAAAPQRQANKGSAEDQVRSVVTQALTTDRPQDCIALFTGRFLAQVEGKPAAEAAEDCRENADGKPLASSLEFRAVDVGDGSAKVVAAGRGGEMGGTVMTLELIRQASWRVDRLRGIEVDRAAYDQAQFAGMREIGFTSAEASCGVARIRRAYPTRRLERAILRGQGQTAAAAAMPCAGPETMRSIVATEIHKAAEARGIPEPVAECVTERITQSVPLRQLQAALSSGDGSAFAPLVARAFEACASSYGAST